MALALTEREAAQLRQLALARGAAQLASLLDRIVAACAGPLAAASQAVDQLSEYVQSPSSGARPAPVVAPALGPSPIERPMSVAEPPVDLRLGVAPSLSEPRLASPRSLAEPPLLQLSQAAPKGEATMLSAQDEASVPASPPRGSRSSKPSGPSQSAALPGPLHVAPRATPAPRAPLRASDAPAPRAPLRVSDAPGPRHSDAPAALPDSLTPPAPVAPNFIGTFFGFRAFGRKAASASRAASSKGESSPLGLGAGRGRMDPIALPPGPPVRLPPARGRVYDVFDERPDRRAKSSTARRSVGESTVPRWSYFLSAGIGLIAVVTASIIAISGHRRDATAGRAPAPAVAVGSAAATPAPPSISAPPSASEVAQRWTEVVHKRGAETPELRALLDTQGRLALACKNDPASCGRGWTPLARDSFTAIAPGSIAVASHDDGPLPAWLQRLKMPQDFPVRDDPVLRAHFDFSTKNIAGRQHFQAKLFECAAYDDIFDSTLVKYGAPAWLTAVVYQESDCNPRATSDVGAKGLWQFMPESARAYGLRVVEGDVDERLNPIKSTEAAIHFLTDLQRKLGSWDLVLAAYNMGPFAILARLSQAGENAGFWDLAHAGVLPEETAQYVPAIESYALILQNLGRLQFSRDGKRLEGTSEIVVKPGTRLSLIARAASTTTLHIRELNPEFLRDVVPEGETAARVPDAEAHRAQTFFESWSPDDNRDTCVSEDFDWGARQFDTSKFAKNCPRADVPP